MVTFGWDVTESQKNDPMNLSMKRNIRNTPKSSYNCAGYALETFSWYCPYPSYDVRHDYVTCIDTKEQALTCTQNCVNQMLQDFPTMRVITSPNEAIAKNEYIIAFRLSSDGDFHFLKRTGNGHWLSKRGYLTNIDTIKAENVEKEWNNRYDMPIVYFAKKRT